MSELYELDETESLTAETLPSVPEGLSLADRMARVRDSIEQDVTEKFPLPGPFGAMLAVELRLLDWRRMRQIIDRTKKVRDEPTRELYMSADHLIAATVSFWELTDDGERELPDETWVSLAKMGVDGLPENLTPRQALFALIRPDSLVPPLFAEWQEWASARKPEADREVMQDFGKTE